MGNSIFCKHMHPSCAVIHCWSLQKSLSLMLRHENRKTYALVCYTDPLERMSLWHRENVSLSNTEIFKVDDGVRKILGAYHNDRVRFSQGNSDYYINPPSMVVDPARWTTKTHSALATIETKSPPSAIIRLSRPVPLRNVKSLSLVATTTLPNPSKSPSPALRTGGRLPAATPKTRIFVLFNG